MHPPFPGFSWRTPQNRGRLTATCTYSYTLQECAYGCATDHCKAQPHLALQAVIGHNGPASRGQPFAITATILDESNQPLAQAAHVSLSVSPAPNLSGPTTADTVGAVATFANLMIPDPGSFTITATAPQLQSGTLSLTVTQWEWRGRGPARPFVVDPTNPDVVYSYSEGLLRSNDAGATWTTINSSLFNWLTIDPRTPSRLYLCGQGLFWSSTDGGATLTSHAIGGCDGITIDPSSSSTIYVSAANGGLVSAASAQWKIFKSGDSGQTWPVTLTPPPGTMSPANVVTVDPSNPQKLFVPLQSEIYFSKDGGMTWQVSFNLDGASYLIAIDPSLPSNVLACGSVCFLSVDGGANFGGHIAGPQGATALASDPNAVGTFYVYSSSTFSLATSVIWRSGDHGASYVQVGQFPARLSFAGYAPSRPSTVYAVFDGETWRSTMAGN